MNQKAKDYIKSNTLDLESNNRMDTTGYVQYAVSEAKAYGALAIAEDAFKNKAIEAFKENCQHPKDTAACECELCVRWVGSHCELLDGFIEKLNS